MKALLLEDDTEQFVAVSKRLAEAFSGIQIQRISTESEFGRTFEKIASNPPDVIIVDVMLRWCDASSEYIPMPPEIRADNGHYRAGFRCALHLANDPRTCTIPIFIYSVLDQTDVQPRIEELGISLRFVRKESYINNLAAEIESIFHNSRRR